MQEHRGRFEAAFMGARRHAVVQDHRAERPVAARAQDGDGERGAGAVRRDAHLFPDEARRRRRLDQPAGAPGRCGDEDKQAQTHARMVSPRELSAP
jgi:hypothetical protein